MKRFRKMVTIVFLLLLPACGPDGDAKVASCEDVQGGRELSFAMAYCQGDFCSTYEDQDGNLASVRTREECESIDVVVSGNIEEWGQDGEPDCMWVEGTRSYCAPNK